MSETPAEQAHLESTGGFAILYAPRRAAAAAANTAAWFPFLAMAIAGGVADYPMLSRLGAAGLSDARLQQTPSGLSSMTVFFFLISQYAAPVMLPLAAWIASLFLAAYLIFFLDARVKRRQVVRVTAWAFLPLALERLLAGLFRALSLNPEANPFNPLASNLGFFLDPTRTRPFWYGLASSLDLFSIWALVAASLALAALGRKTAASVFPGVIFAWAAGVLLKSAILA